MDWVTGIQKAIDEMEAHLLCKPDMDRLGKIACSSAYQFQRVFHILSGFTVREYIRNRRLTLAARELQSGENKVIDIAFKYGYETPESFARAFERFHGVLPSAACKIGTPLKSFLPLKMKVKLEGGSVMDYRVETMKPLRLLGKAQRQYVEGVKADKFWDRCREDGTLEELTRSSTSPEKEWIGIADSTSYDGKSYLYYIATPYDGAAIPDGYTVMTLPARLWIRFRCVSLGAENTANNDIWPKIYSEFFPASGYEPAEYQLEVYPCGDGTYPDDVSEVWIAARKRPEQ